MEDHVKAFLERRPYYTDGHVREISEYAHRDGIPWCSECADWHFPEDEHTED